MAGPRRCRPRADNLPRPLRNRKRPPRQLGVVRFLRLGSRRPQTRRQILQALAADRHETGMYIKPRRFRADQRTQGVDEAARRHLESHEWRVPEGDQ
jgi:hypothetical protein